MNPQLDEVHPPLDLLDYQDKVNYLIKYAIRDIYSKAETKQIKVSEDSKSHNAPIVYPGIDSDGLVTLIETPMISVYLRPER